MKTLNNCRMLALVAALGATPLLTPAQLLSEAPKHDSVVAVVAEAAGLSLISPDELPWYGTFWEVQNTVPCIRAPLPYPPLDPILSVYAIADGQFLVDASSGQMLVSQRKLAAAGYTVLVQQQVKELADFIASLQSSQAVQTANLTVSTLDSDDPPPLPGEGGGMESPVTNAPPVYSLGLGLCLYPPVVTSNSIAIDLRNTPGSSAIRPAAPTFST